MPPVAAPSGAPASSAQLAASEQPATVGLSSAEAAERLRQDGPNAIGGSGRRTRLAILVAQVASPLVLILVAASLVSLVVGDDINASIILAIVVMSAALGFVHEARSEAAIAALQARLTLRASVVRDGIEAARWAWRSRACSRATRCTEDAGRTSVDATAGLVGPIDIVHDVPYNAHGSRQTIVRLTTFAGRAGRQTR